MPPRNDEVTLKRATEEVVARVSAMQVEASRNGVALSFSAAPSPDAQPRPSGV